MGEALNDEFAPGETSLARRAAAVRRVGRADDGMRAVGRAGAAAVSAVLRQPAGPQREPRRVALQLAPDEARKAVLGRHLRAGVVHAVEDHRQRLGQHAARRRHVERRAGRHLAVRARAQRRDRAATTRRTCCRPRSSTSCRSAGQEAPERRRRDERVGRRVAGEHDLPLLVRDCRCSSESAARLQRPGPFRAGCIPAIVNPDAVFAQDKGSFDPAKGPLFNKDAFEPVSAFNFYHGQRQSYRGERPRVRVQEPGPVVHQEHADAGQHERAVPIRDRSTSGTGTCFMRTRLTSEVTAFNTDIASADFGKWNGAVTDPRTMQLAADSSSSARSWRRHGLARHGGGTESIHL